MQSSEKDQKEQWKDQCELIHVEHSAKKWTAIRWYITLDSSHGVFILRDACLLWAKRFVFWTTMALVTSVIHPLDFQSWFLCRQFPVQSHAFRCCFV